MDSFRTAIAKRVSDALPPLTIEQVYSGVDYGKKGVDFTVALPRFRLPGKVDELASKVISNVSVEFLRRLIWMWAVRLVSLCLRIGRGRQCHETLCIFERPRIGIHLVS